MVRAWIETRQVTPPAIWGKLPGHADFVRSGVRHRESEGWAAWLAQVAGRPAGGDEALEVAQGAAALPVAFLLPPGTLAFAPRRFVVGVIAPSSDRVGRQHPLLVYQLARPGWVRRQFGPRTHTQSDWLFWLARAVARQLGHAEGADRQPLERLVGGLWALYTTTPQRQPRTASAHRGETAQPQADGHAATAQALLDELAGPPPADDPAARLRGVRHLPWADWPQRLLCTRPSPVFWQQDAEGGYVNAATSLAQLWYGAQAGPATAVTPHLPAGQGVAASDDEFDLTDLATPWPENTIAPAGDTDPFGMLGIEGARGGRPPDPLAQLLGEAPTAPVHAPLAPPPLRHFSDADAPGESGPSPGLFDRLHEEFVRAVRDPSQVGGTADWEVAQGPGGEPAPSLEQLSRDADRYALLRDILLPREDIERLIDRFDPLNRPNPLEGERSEDVLRLFAPELARDVHKPLPSLTLREHRELAPDSHVRIGPTQPAPQAQAEDGLPNGRAASDPITPSQP